MGREAWTISAAVVLAASQTVVERPSLVCLRRDLSPIAGMADLQLNPMLLVAWAALPDGCTFRLAPAVVRAGAAVRARWCETSGGETE